jgi:hypothetical protein
MLDQSVSLLRNMVQRIQKGTPNKRVHRCKATMHQLTTYLAVESGGDQSGHDNHGDHDLDGVRDGRSHVESLFSVDQCKSEEVSNYEMREWKGRGKPTLPTQGSTAWENLRSPNLASLGTKIFSNNT